MVLIGVQSVGRSLKNICWRRQNEAALSEWEKREDVIMKDLDEGLMMNNVSFAKDVKSTKSAVNLYSREVLVGTLP